MKSESSLLQCEEDATHSGALPHTVTGCHVAHPSTRQIWWLDQTPFDASEFFENDGSDSDSVELPDLSLDPDSHVLSLLNSRDDVLRAFTLSIENFQCLGIDRRPLQQCPCDSSEPERIGRLCTTFVVVVPPRTVFDVCHVVIPRGESVESVQLFSDIRELPLADYVVRPLDVAALDVATVRHRVALPLDSNAISSFRCSQGCGGHFTHFLPQTRFAIDLECPIGTTVRAVADGVVREVKCDVTSSGAHTLNLWRYNIVSVEHDDGTYADFVHVRANSAVVSVGERVSRGQKLCESGNVGFCPVPHLHFQLAESSADDALPVPFVFIADNDPNHYFLPMAGQFCNTHGLI